MNPIKTLASFKRRFPAALLILPLASGALAEETNLFRGVYFEPGKTAADYRNVALNPLDSTNGEPVSFPHATSNSEYNQREFAARCAIDGNRRNDDVHDCGSWGPRKEPGIWWRLDFGRPVEIDKLVLFLRAAWTPADAPHDSYWQGATVEFSDGSAEKLALKQVAAGQEFPLVKRTVSWLALNHLKPAADKWCALCEFEAWGQDAAEFAYVPDAAFAAQLRQDPLVAKAMAAMMGFQRASWEQGVVGQALLEAGERDAAIALARASLVYVNPSGVVAAMGGSTTDPLMLGECLWWSARQTGDAELAKPRMPCCNSRSKGRPAPRTAHRFIRPIRRKCGPMAASPRRLFSRQPGESTRRSLNCWACINGYGTATKNSCTTGGPRRNRRWWDRLSGVAATAGPPPLLPASFAHCPPTARRIAPRLAAMLKELLDGCLAHQRKDGLFCNDIDNPSAFVETNLASMLAYAIYESVRGGWLPESYLAHADAMRAAVRAKVDRFGFVQGVAGAPRFDRPGISAEGQAFFILMEAAARKTGR